jgi:hypothetical protein
VREDGKQRREESFEIILARNGSILYKIELGGGVLNVLCHVRCSSRYNNTTTLRYLYP